MSARSDERVLVLTCEHGGHAVPAAYRALFRGHEARLKSHEGWDPGALELARELRRKLSRVLPTTLVAATTTRLLIDLNRSATNPRAFSSIVRALSWSERTGIVWRHYLPHLTAVVTPIAEAHLRGATVVHLGVHSFTPVLRGARRDFEIGLLYDPKRPGERRFCDAWRAALARTAPELRVRRNAPYRGTSDGLTTILRRRFDDRYLGIELEVNQAIPLRGGQAWSGLCRTIAKALAQVLQSQDWDPS